MKGKKILCAVLSVFMLLGIAACSGKNKVNQSSQTKPNIETADKGNDPLGKFQEPITLTTVRSEPAGIKFVNGENWDNNVWSKEMESKLGIKLKHLWTTAAAQYKIKLSTSIASNDIPDFFTVIDADLLNMLVESDMLADLSSAYNEYGSDLLKKGYDNESGKIALSNATYDGRLLGIPQYPVDPALRLNVLYIRADWLKKLNIPVPETVDDLLKACEAFANKDPDGNGKNDTYGLALSKDGFGSVPQGVGDIHGIFNALGAYPYGWLDDGSGKLINGLLQPQMKESLQKLQELYKTGAVDKEFAVKDRYKVQSEIKAGKIGAVYGVLWTLNANEEFRNNHEWTALPILPKESGKPVKALSDVTTNGTFVVSNKCKNPEALIKMLNLTLEYRYGETIIKGGEEFFKKFFQTNQGKKDNIGVIDYNPTKITYGDHNLSMVELTRVGVLQKKGPEYQTYPDAKSSYKYLLDYVNGIDKSEEAKLAYDANMMLSFPVNKVQCDYRDNHTALLNKYSGPVTETMGQKGAAMEDLAKTVMIKIILGEPISTYDKFISDWKTLGGDQITREVNEWYANNKK